MKGEAQRPSFDLRVRTKDFALRIVKMFVGLPMNEDTRDLGNQVLRSGTSAGASCREFLAESKIVRAAELSALQDEWHQLLATLTTTSKNSKARYALHAS